MYNPISTYRIQFNKDFTFRDLERIIPYLQKLGIGTLYASPVFTASPGSTHGYDGTNPNQINPEIGTESELRKLSTILKEKGIGWLQDIVPNHMAFHPGNSWLMDVLEKGQDSTYINFFDIDRNGGKLMVPFLNAPLDEAIRKGELTLTHSDDGETQSFKYFDNEWPLNKESYVNGTAAISEINQDPEMLKGLADQQHYRLCHWLETDHHINYRRFFTVNGLICLNIQHQQVFDEFHKLTAKLLSEQVFQGLRLDHIDGLHDPSAYLDQLRKLTGEQTYIVAEKILERSEALLKQWPIQGSTGYDFLAIANNLFTDTRNEEEFTAFYEEITNDTDHPDQQVYDKKSYILYHHMAGELENLFLLFDKLDLIDKKASSTYNKEDLKTAIADFLIYCPVYRYYNYRFPLDAEDAKAIEQVFLSIRNSGRKTGTAIAILEDVLLYQPHRDDREYNSRVQQFYQRCMQFTGPLMAKGVEDTLMYTYNRFIGHNDVGDSPRSFGYSTKEFHQKMIERQEKWPLSINTTSTHDTKRGEDSRARLNVLSAMPSEWKQIVREWKSLNDDIRPSHFPDDNDEYFIYQTMVAAYPMPGDEHDHIGQRLEEYLCKALREAKRHSTYTSPNNEYEEAAISFVRSLLDVNRPFLQSFSNFHRQIADYGIINSLSQMIVKFTSPGIPDTYQGTELWDLSLVDPDNRRPVNYPQRMQWLEAFELDLEINRLWADRYTGRIKLWMLHSLSQIRKKYQDVFSFGEYIALKTEGEYKEHTIAYARKYRQTWLITIVPLHLNKISSFISETAAADWKDTRILLPDGIETGWEDLLTGKKNKGQVSRELLLNEILSPLPLAVLKMQGAGNPRGAGVLMHISSLPSLFGIGDMGPESISFADFLGRSGQKFWQILPLNPTETEMGHSPYSSISSRAGNTLLISPELLVKEGWLEDSDLAPFHLSKANQADYHGAERVRLILFEKAYRTFMNKSGDSAHEEFKAFCINESEWLDEFALYKTIKKEQGESPWFIWPDKYKFRDKQSIEDIRSNHADEINKMKWLQYIFFHQWSALKDYCNRKGIRLIGDLPFYVSYDSVDVWSNRDIFKLDEKGNMTAISGVPPDLFSADGQLWGMPVFNWEALKQSGYTWWINRLKKNTALFDIVRLDHFRAFADYWQVPATEKTAKNGEWKKGPGADFFRHVENALGKLPFIAEDLGEINKAVPELRNKFKLPGMNVLQFAFDEHMSSSPYIPHNYISNSVVYTGTHDNNTVAGWYRKDADEDTINRLETYTGSKSYENDIHLIFARMALSSVAATCILPVQDILGLDEASRMNKPSTGGENWLWRMIPGQIDEATEKMLRQWTTVYNRL